MDEEQTGGYREPCGLCAAVDWGISDEGRFYCRSCHNVIERTRDVVDTNTLMMGSHRVSSISRSTKNAQIERGQQWMICEGFQFILKNQAEVLINLGVSSCFKDVLCQFWRIYLQKTRQAYNTNLVSTSKFKAPSQDSESDSGPESIYISASETEEAGGASEAGWTSEAGSISETREDAYSGSLDAKFFITPGQRRSLKVMSMSKTLALCYLALLWSREAVTLADLLRLVNEGCVPYLNAHEVLPEEMRLYGHDALIFRVQSVPSHRVLHKEAWSLAVFLDLPPFPPVTQDCLLHPSLLTIRYLAEVNLPDELHDFVLRVIKQAGMEDEVLHSFKPRRSRCDLPLYDVQAVAIILVTMKLLFRLDDSQEWGLAKTAAEMNKETPGENCFNIRKWYKMVESALTRARQRREEHIARKQWKSHKVLYSWKKYKPHFFKRRRVAEQLQVTFQKLSGSSPGAPPSSPCSFCFRWGEEGEEGEAVDGPSLHQQNLDSVVQMPHGDPQPSNPTYWHPLLGACRSKGCRSHYDQLEDTLPQMFVWSLKLFSFLLHVQPSCVYEEVLKVERRFLPWKKKKNSQTKEEATPREELS